MNPVGRPRKRNEICPYPNCGQLGFSYITSIKKSEKNIYQYLRFRHYDTTLKDHDIDQNVRVKKPKYATEYNRKLNEATAFSHKPYLKRYDYLNSSPINSDINEVLPVVVYDFGFKIIPKQVKNKLEKLNDLGLKVSEKEIDWLLRQKQVRNQHEVKKFYENISKIGHIIMVGEKAVKKSYRISRLKNFTGNIVYQNDKFEMFAKILKMRERKKNLSDSCDDTYNKPPRILQEIVTQEECILSS
ncbi:MAG: hypothetical protein ACRD97_07600 [Nitrososphaeraceae archaeon]